MQNIFEYLAQFDRMAKRAQWPQERIAAVRTDAMSSDYEHALEVLLEVMDEIQGNDTDLVLIRKHEGKE
jgi:hypothetical protein